MGISTDHSKPTQAIIVDFALHFFWREGVQFILNLETFRMKTANPAMLICCDSRDQQPMTSSNLHTCCYTYYSSLVLLCSVQSLLCIFSTSWHISLPFHLCTLFSPYLLT